MDLVQKKLELVDLNFSLSPSFVVSRIIRTAPLVIIAAGIITGIIWQQYLPLNIGIYLALCIVSAVSAVAIAVLKKQRTNQFVIALLTFLCFFALGGIRLLSFNRIEPNHISVYVPEQKLAQIRGRITTEPYINRNDDWAFSRYTFTDPGSSFYMDVTEAKMTDGWAKLTGKVYVHTAEVVHGLHNGDYVELLCTLNRFSPATNPGQFDIADYMLQKKVLIAASVKNRESLEILSSQKNIFFQFKSKLQRIVSNALLADIEQNETGKGLTEALLLGYRGNIDNQTRQAFQRTGLLHFISLSGLHFGILIGIIWWLCKTAGLSRRIRAATCILAAVLFLLVIPIRAPALRAAVIIIIFCLSILFRRHPNPFNSLALAALLLLIFKPADLFNAGWQLSFSTTSGILLFCGRIQLFLYEKVLSMFSLVKKTDRFSLVVNQKSLFNLTALFSTGISAWLGGAGIILYHFKVITPLASIWTVIVFPFVAVILTVGFLKVILALLLPGVASALTLILNAVSYLLIIIVKLLAKVSFSELLIGNVPLWPVFVYYAAVLFAGFFYFRKPLIRRMVLSILIIVLAGFFSISFVNFRFDNSVSVTVLDAGDGQVIIARLPGSKTILLDAGSLHRSDPGRRIVIPFLRSAGIDKINACILSHGDIDHINAIPEIIESCKVKSIYAGRSFFSNASQYSPEGFLAELVEKQGLEIKPLGDELKLSRTISVKKLWPINTVDVNDLSDNDASLVLALDFAGRKILFCSDIEKTAQRSIMELYPDLKADVVIVPHHGSIITLDKDFLESLNARIHICSAGKRRSQNAAKLQIPNTLLFYTSADGAVTVKIDSKGNIKERTFLK